MNIIDFLVVDDLRINYSDIETGGFTLNREIVADVHGGEYQLKQKLLNGINLKIRANLLPVNRISFEAYLTDEKLKILKDSYKKQAALFSSYKWGEDEPLSKVLLVYSHSPLAEYEYCLIEEYKQVDISIIRGKINHLVSFKIIEIPYK